MVRILEASDRTADFLASSGAASLRQATRVAARIVADVQRRGDAAVVHWTRTYDGGSPRPPFEVTPAELRAGWRATPASIRAALKQSIRHLTIVGRRQRPSSFGVTVIPGVRIEETVRPYARVGCYVPSGRHPLPSTLLMTVVPARLAGVPEIIVVCPRPTPVVLCAALEAGATRVLRIGGAQAIAALAYGTKAIARVDKIVGPGNMWVAAAKSLVAADCAVDAHAGPSEVVIYVNAGTSEWIAADLVAQAEHDPDARAIFVTTSRTLAERVGKAVRQQSTRFPVAAEALRRHGAIVIVNSRPAAVRLINRLAPEHLVIEADDDARQFETAGTVLVGPWAAPAASDYSTGSNHVLPTGGAARFRGGLSVSDFVRISTVQRLTRRGLAGISAGAIALAEAEGLRAHAESMRIRTARGGVQ
jgi:histidinol dehydrogenase